MTRRLLLIVVAALGLAAPVSAQVTIVPSKSVFVTAVTAPPSGTCVTPTVTITGDLDSGVGWLGANNIALCAGGATVVDVTGARVLFAQPILGPDGTAALPSLSFGTTPTAGAWIYAANSVAIQSANAANSRIKLTATFLFPDVDAQINLGTSTNRWASIFPTTVDFGSSTQTLDAANILALKNGTNAQIFRVYKNTTGPVYASLDYTASRFVLDTATNTGITLGGNSTSVALNANLIAASVGNFAIGSSSGAAGSNFTSLWLSAPQITAAASVAAGGTVNNSGDHTRQRYQITIAPATGDCSTGFNTAGLTADCTIATIPAGTKLVAVYADVTAAFTCSGTCTGTKVLRAGITAGGTEIFATSLNVATTATYGLADADLGSAMTRAAAIQGGYTPSWSGTTPVIVRFTSGTGNWGSGAATFVNAGVAKFTLITEQVK